jgi:hypothetical protein
MERTMRIGDYDYRDVRGVGIRRLPAVRKDALGGLPASASLTLDYIRAAIGSPLDDDWQAVFTSLQPILEQSEQVDMELLGQGDAAQADMVRAMACELARWHDAIWYPKGEALSDAFLQNYPRARSADASFQGHHQTIVFTEECPKMLCAWDADCRAAMAEHALAAAMAGKSVQEAIKSEEVTEVIAGTTADRQAAASTAEYFSIAELVAEFVAGNGPAVSGL